jgi:tRNA(Ile)-lysidine synthase
VSQAGRRGLIERVRRTIRQHRLIGPGDRVVVALSGGPDSVALLYVLHDLAGHEGFGLAGVAHFNHHLRPAADEDERFCADLAARFDLPFEAGSADVRALAREGRRSVEEAARSARYRFLRGTAERLGANRVAVGHTSDDQAETFLLKLFRGAGLKGLAGIHPCHGPIVRPLLDVGRADLLEMLTARALPFRQDETNLDLANPRNRIRHELLPWIERHLSPGVKQALARAAEIARADTEFLDEAATGAAEGVRRTEGPDTVTLEGPALTRLPRALARRVVRDALERLARGRFVGFDHVEAVLELAADPAAAPIDLPGQRAARLAGRVVLTAARRRRRATPAEANSLRQPLSIPGEVCFEPGGWVISAARPPETHEVGSPGPTHAVVGTAGLELPLAVRTRRPGDAFRPPGLGGRKKLQDFFVDRKVPRAGRDSIPIVVDAADRIVWVVGHAVADDFRVTGRPSGVIILTAKQLGGTG